VLWQTKSSTEFGKLSKGRRWVEFSSFLDTYFRCSQCEFQSASSPPLDGLGCVMPLCRVFRESTKAPGGGWGEGYRRLPPPNLVIRGLPPLEIPFVFLSHLGLRCEQVGAGLRTPEALTTSNFLLLLRDLFSLFWEGGWKSLFSMISFLRRF